LIVLKVQSITLLVLIVVLFLFPFLYRQTAPRQADAGGEGRKTS